MEFSKKQIRKIILQVKYEPTGNFVDKRGEILDLLSEEWEHRKFGHDRISLKDEEKNLQGLITWKMSQISVENVTLLSNFHDYAKNYFPNDLWKIMDIDNFTFMGCRTMIVLPSENFNELVNKFSKLYSISRNQWDIIGNKPKDVGFPFVFENDKRKVNLNFGPMKKEQMESQFFSITNDLPEVGLFIDSDYLERKDYESSKIRTFLKQATNFADKKACKFVKNLVEGDDDGH